MLATALHSIVPGQDPNPRWPHMSPAESSTAAASMIVLEEANLISTWYLSPFSQELPPFSLNISPFSFSLYFHCRVVNFY